MEKVVARKIKSIEQIPGFTNISAFSSFVGYLQTEACKTLLSKWQKATACKKRQKMIAGGAAITVFIFLYFYGEKLLYEIVLSLATFGVASIFIYLAARREKKARKEYFSDRRNYGLKIADFVSTMLKANYRSFFNGELFIYSNDFCSLIWVDNVNMVTYQKKNIKDVNLERVNIRSKNNLPSEKISTENKNSNLKNDYGWRLDIFSNMPEYPKITLIFKEDEQDIAGQIKSILEPKKK